MKSKFLENVKANYKKLLFVVLPIFVIFLVGDLLVKHFINANMEVGESKSFLPGFINLVNVHNEGAAWSIFSGKQIFLVVFTFIFLIAFVYFLLRESNRGAFFHISSAFIITGCIGNLIDRLAFNYVRDMIQFDFWKSFPVFNIADICVCVGFFMLAVYFIIALTKASKKEEKSEK